MIDNSPRSSIRSNTSRFQATPLLGVGATRTISAPEWTGSPGSPTDIYIIGCHVVDNVGQVAYTLSSVSRTKLGDHSLETILLKPACKRRKSGRRSLATVSMSTRRVRIQILMNLKG